MSKVKEAAKGLFKGSTWKAAVKEDRMNWSETTAQFVIDTVSGIGGGALGNLFGPWAMIPAVPLNVIGNKTGHRWLRAASIAMIASGFEDAVSANKTTDTGFNIKNELADGKERVKSYFGKIKRKFGLDKVFGSSSSTTTTTDQNAETTNGLGTATFDSLDKHEQQIVSNAIEHESGAAPNAGSPMAKAVEPDVTDAFSMSGLDDLNTPHII